MGIRSERRLCEEVHLNLAYRWFYCVNLTDPVPDHSTFSKNRHGRFRYSDLLRHLFETVVARCIEEGVASGQRFAADASIIQADANRQNSTPKSDWQPDKIDPEEAPRAVREYLATLDDAAFGAASPVEPKFTYTASTGRTNDRNLRRSTAAQINPCKKASRPQTIAPSVLFHVTQARPYTSLEQGTNLVLISTG